MKRVGLASLCLAGVSVAFWFLAGSISQRGTGTQKRDVAGLQPVYADVNAPAATTRSLPTPSVMHLSPERLQLSGVRLGRVEKTSTTHMLRTFGRVMLDERRVFPVSTGGEGWVSQISPGTGTGDTVKQGQPLVSVYGRDFTAAQRGFLYALRAFENPPPSTPGDAQDPPSLTFKEARLVLQNMGFGEAQIQQLTKDRQVMLDVSLTAPAGGVIVTRNVFPQQKFDRGAELFRIADLSHVWVIADVLGGDAAYIRSGDTARLSLPKQPATALRARVGEALPRFDRESRTLQVRLEADNPQLILRPDMLVDLEFTVTLAEAITVPADAVVDSGLHSTVFVNRGEGVFESRVVDTGWRFGDRVQIVRGVNPGESIAVSGTFLLDSESRMRQQGSGKHD